MRIFPSSLILCLLIFYVADRSPLAQATGEIFSTQDIWNISQVRELIRKHHVLQPAYSDIPNEREALEVWLSTNDRYSSISPIVGSRNHRSLGLLKITNNSDGITILPLKDGPTWQSGVTTAVRITNPDALIHQNRIVGIRLDTGQRIDEHIKPDYYDSGNIEITHLGEIPALRVTGFVAERTVDSARYFLTDYSAPVVSREIAKNSSIAEFRVLDLRYCAGGDVFEATDFGGMWIQERVHWVSLLNTGREFIPLETGGRDVFKPAPSVILVSNYTASACEQLVLGLKKYTDALILGQQTAGKCSLQTSTPLIGGYWLKITTGIWLGPSNVACDDRGLKPDKIFNGNLHNDKEVGIWISQFM